MREENELSAGASRPRLTPVDVQQQQFKRSFRGYDEQEVDDFLDRVTEAIGGLLEENEGLKEQARRAPTSPLEGAQDAAVASRTVDEIRSKAEEDAESILRDAHARADAIVRDAEIRAGAIGRGGAPPPTVAEGGHLSRFVTRERSFLQELAALIQSHAEGVKSMVQDARGQRDAPDPEPIPSRADSAERSRAPFGPPGATAGRDIDAADDAAAATAGTADADQDEPGFGAPPRRAEGDAERPPAAAMEEAVPVPPQPSSEIIDIPEAPEDRTAEEAWAPPAGRVEAGASVRSSRGTGDLDEEEDIRRREPAPESDSSLGDLFWGED